MANSNTHFFLKNKMIDSSGRNSNLEILRIIFMLMIIGSHMAEHAGRGGGIEYRYFLGLPTNNAIGMVLLGSWGQLGVYGFVAISSYFIVKGSEFHPRKVLDIVIRAHIIGMIYILISIATTGLPEDLLQYELFPVYYQYWFIKIYLMFYISSPFLMIVIKKFSMDTVKMLLIVSSALMLIYIFYDPSSISRYFSFIWTLLLVYYVENGGRIISAKGSLILFLFICVIYVLATILTAEGVLAESMVVRRYMVRLHGHHMLTMYLAVAIMFVFVDLPQRNIKWVNKAASHTFGVYLFHENFFMAIGVYGNGSSNLWQNIFHLADIFSESYFILYTIGCIILVFIVGSIVDSIVSIPTKWIIRKVGL